MFNNKSGRPIVIAGNWKMYKTRSEAVELAQSIVEMVESMRAKANAGEAVRSDTTALGNAGEAIGSRTTSGEAIGSRTISEASKFGSAHSEPTKPVTSTINKKPYAAGVPQVMLFPPFTSIEYVATAVKGTGILVGAQNMNQHDSGGFTGEISPGMLIDCGARAVLVGHSERRHIFHETDADVHAKLIAAVNHNLIAVLCVGETLEQKEAGETDAVIERQISTALNGVSFSNPDRLIIAYEPVWSIGTGKVCGPEEASRVTGKIREMLLLEAEVRSFADEVPILYGGSVKPGNVAAQLAQDNIGGVLVGGASLTAAEFVPIIEAGIRS